MKSLITLSLLIGVLLISQAQCFSDTEEQVLVKNGDIMETYSLEDQHGALQNLQPGTEVVIMSFDMKVSKEFHKTLKGKEKTYLSDNKIEYIVDIRGMPSLVTWMFAGPKMRKYKFPILLVKEGNFPDKFPKQEGKFTILKLDPQHNITDISYIGDIKKVIEYIDDKAYRK